LNNVNPNGENVATKNLNHANLFFFLNVKNLLQNQASYVIFSKGCHNYLQNQGCHKGRFWRKITVRTSFSSGVRGHHPDVCARQRLPCGRGFTRGRVFTIRQRGKNRVRADARKNLKKF
jgi:hypothetical protein